MVCYVCGLLAKVTLRDLLKYKAYKAEELSDCCAGLGQKSTVTRLTGQSRFVSGGLQRPRLN
jgi:hypothetical protein